MNFLARKAALFLLVVVTLFSCKKDPVEIGLPQEQTIGVFFDSLTLHTSTVLVDSVRTSLYPMSSFLLAGHYADNKLGIVTAKSFLQIWPATDTLKLGTSPILDSLVLLLKPVYSYGDTTQMQSMYVHQLTEDIIPANDSSKVYYNTGSVSYEDAPIGSVTFSGSAYMPKDTTIRVRLSNDLGNEVIGMAGQYWKDFASTFNGLALIPGTINNAAILGFRNRLNDKESSPVAILRLYYKSDGTQKSYDFVVGHYFNQIQSDRSSTALASIQKPYDSIPASQTDEETYVQGGIGLMTKIEFSNIQKLKEKGNIAINSAQLIIEPVEGTYNSFTPLPPQLILYQVSDQGKLLKNSNGYGIPMLGGYNLGTPLIAVYNTTTKSYVFDLGGSIQQILRKPQATFKAYLSVPSIFLNPLFGDSNIIRPSTSLEDNTHRLVLGSSRRNSNAIKLKIYYTQVK